MIPLQYLQSAVCGALCAALLAAAPAPAAASNERRAQAGERKAQAQSARQQAARAAARDGEAEARLIEVYKLIAQAQTRQALARAEALVREHPNFQLAQLVYGDLLAAQTRPLRAMGDAPEEAARNGTQTLAELREESLLRIHALRERPPAGMVPAQFVRLSPRNRHAIAVDASRARLYLFENTPSGLRLVADYYTSVGKAGIDKSVEGDQRTPLGVYFITSNLDPNTLKDFYGGGALPINYPNPLDLRRGKTGSGIWLHGTPPEQFARAPKATDGCVVLANPDLLRIIRTVEVRTTPVVIAQRLDWVPPARAEADNRSFSETLAAWQAAKGRGDLVRALSFYARDFSAGGKSLADMTRSLQTDIERARGRPIALKDLSYLRWSDTADTMVVTFGEVVEGARTGPVKRQYWMRQGGGSWKIFFEGVIG